MSYSVRPARGISPFGRAALGVLAAVALAGVACDGSSSSAAMRDEPQLASDIDDPSGGSSTETTGDASSAGSIGVGLETSPKVTIRTTEKSFPSGDPIVTVIRNRRSRSITATSGRTYCTIVTLQRKRDDGWRAEGLCTDGLPPGDVRIEKHSRLRVRIGPREGDEDLPAGTYRAVLTYRVGDSDKPKFVSYSARFEVTPTS